MDNEQNYFLMREEIQPLSFDDIDDIDDTDSIKTSSPESVSTDDSQ